MKKRSSLIAFIFTILAMGANFSAQSQAKNINYHNTVKRIITNNCISCHSGKTPSAGLYLKGYNNLVDAVKNKNLLKRINDPSDPMPTSGLLPKKERLAIEQWIKNDFAKGSPNTSQNPYSSYAQYQFKAPLITPINIEEKGFEFLEKIQGHWVGKIFLLGQNLPWFAFDFRAINSSQVHALFEGGSMGNLFNTFFVAKYKGVTTIMLRNGGILGGIYRTSYFVLTKADHNEYLFEDAYGGKQIMWVKISFRNQKMNMLVHTSKLGMNKASKHMEFEGRNLNPDLAEQAARRFHFPNKQVVKSFPAGMPLPYYGDEYPVVTSASYIAEDENADYIRLGKLANDPIKITNVENIASIDLQFKRTDLSKNKNISVYLSREPLSKKNGQFRTQYGYISEKAMNQVLLFPEIDKKTNEFTLSYLHTGKCYITFVIDNNKDLVPNTGDYYSKSLEINLQANQTSKLVVDNISKVIK